MPNDDVVDLDNLINIGNVANDVVDSVGSLIDRASNLRVGTNPTYALSTFLDMYPAFAGPVKKSTNISTTGTLVVDSNAITAIPSTSSLAVGIYVSGTGIPAWATITAITDSTSITISDTATVAGTTVALTFVTPAISKTALAMYLTIALNCLQKARWKGMWEIGISLFIAHFATLQLQATNVPMGTASQLVAAGKALGLNTSKSVGDVSAGYDYSMMSNNFGRWGSWNLTLYGQQLITMANLLGKAGMYVY